MRCTILLTLLCTAAAGCHDHGLPGEDMAVNNDMSAGGEDMSVGDLGVPDDARKFVTFTQFAMDFAQALCTHYMTCGQLDAAQMNACIERNLRHTGWDQDVEIMKGRMQINEAQCLDAVNNSRCDSSDVGAWTSRCLQFLYTPHQANGDTCLSFEECTSGYCAHSGSDAGMPEQPNGCPGTCATPKATGAACRVSSDCAADSYCDRITTHTCVKLATLNEACSGSFGGSGPPCLFGLLCPTFATNPTCVLPSTQAMLHGACDPWQGVDTATPACATGMYCQVQYTSNGVACTGPSQCTTPASYCDTTAGTCKVPSGGQCEMKLAAMATCDPKNEGYFSFGDNQCADGTHCTKLPAQTAYSCQAFNGAAGDCSSDGDCKVGLSCVSNKCTSWFNDGQGCGTTSAPQAGMCASDACIADNADAGTFATCQQVKGFGASCVPGFEDSLCQPTDLVGSTGCNPTTGGAGVCAPKCF